MKQEEKQNVPIVCPDRVIMEYNEIRVDDCKIMAGDVVVIAYESEEQAAQQMEFIREDFFGKKEHIHIYGDPLGQKKRRDMFMQAFINRPRLIQSAEEYESVMNPWLSKIKRFFRGLMG